MKTRIIRINGKSPSFADNFPQDKEKKLKRVLNICKRRGSCLFDSHRSFYLLPLPGGGRIRPCGISTKEIRECQFRGKIHFKLQQDFLYLEKPPPFTILIHSRTPSPSTPSSSSQSSSSHPKHVQNLDE